MDEIKKICNSCKTPRRVSYFYVKTKIYKNRPPYVYIDSECKMCISEKNRIKYEKNVLKNSSKLAEILPGK